MSVALTLMIVAVKTLTLILGGSITYFAYKAYRRTAIQPMLALTIGFGTITLGTLFAGIIDRFIAVTGDVAIVVEGAFMAVGFAVVLYSLYS